MANSISPYLTKSLDFIQTNAYLNQAKAYLPKGNALIRNTAAGAISSLAFKAVNPEWTIATGALPAFVGTVIEPAVTAATDRLHAFLERKYVTYFLKTPPLHQYSDTNAYKCAALIMRSAAPVLATHSISQALGFDVSLAQTALLSFALPKVAAIVEDKVNAEIAKRVIPAAVVEPVSIEVEVLPA